MVFIVYVIHWWNVKLVDDALVLGMGKVSSWRFERVSLECVMISGMAIELNLRSLVTCCHIFDYLFLGLNFVFWEIVLIA